MPIFCLKRNFKSNGKKGNHNLAQQEEISLPDFQNQSEASVPLTLPPLEYEKKPDSFFESVRKSLFTQKKKPVIRKKESPYFAIFLASCILLLAGMFLWDHFRRESATSDSFAPVPMARITELIDPQWEEGFTPCPRGKALASGESIRLKSGMIQITLENGVQQIVQGPCQFEVNNPNHVFCTFGNLSVFVPPEGVGFTVSSPFGKIVDHGTEFHTEITEQGIQVDVIRGQVDFVGSDGIPIRLFGENAVRSFGKKAPEKISFQPKKYISAPEFHSRLLTATGDLLRRKEEQKKTWIHSPGLIFHCDFSKGLARTFPNEAAGNPDQPQFAWKTGCSSSEGSLYNTEAVKFARTGDRIELDCPKIDQSFSFDLTLRVDQLNSQVNTLFMSERFYEEPGGILWQIGREKDLLFGISGSGIRSRNEIESMQKIFRIDQALTNSELGAWIRLTLVVDAQNKEVRQYKNGKLISSEKGTDSIPPLNPGRIVIGNSASTKKYGSLPRFLNGAIENFSIYDRVLTPEEI
ncbi:MAG: LamG-like jellyroll fold domain-containing protein [Planctomycetia bacterium]|nr:LamG-like jellyroll fold domain-containing protein [Planctomycetia bacterium]